jgi:hypothetical protein
MIRSAMKWGMAFKNNSEEHPHILTLDERNISETTVTDQ